MRSLKACHYRAVLHAEPDVGAHGKQHQEERYEGQILRGKLFNP